MDNFWSLTAPKPLFLCFTEESHYRFESTWEWTNDKNFHFEWTTPLDQLRLGKVISMKTGFLYFTY